MHGHDPPADFVGDQDQRAWQLRQGVDQAAGFAFKKRAIEGLVGFRRGRAGAVEQQVGEPQRQAIDDDAGIRRRQFVQPRRQMKWLLDRMPVGGAALAVVPSAG
mgnify:CR=1 FL=1